MLVSFAEFACWFLMVIIFYRAMYGVPEYLQTQGMSLAVGVDLGSGLRDQKSRESYMVSIPAILGDFRTSPAPDWAFTLPSWKMALS